MFFQSIMKGINYKVKEYGTDDTALGTAVL